MGSVNGEDTLGGEGAFELLQEWPSEFSDSLLWSSQFVALPDVVGSQAPWYVTPNEI